MNEKYHTPQSITDYMNSHKRKAMTVEERTVFFMDFINKQCLPTLGGKGKDYGSTEDANQNFKRVAKNLGLTKYQVWSVYFNKHIDAINNSIKNNPESPARKMESLQESLKDVINYSGILLSMLEEDTLGSGGSGLGTGKKHNPSTGNYNQIPIASKEESEAHHGK